MFKLSEKLSPILGPLGGTALCYGIYHLAQFIHHELTYPLRNVRGPRNASLFFGNLRQLRKDAHLTKKWREEFGSTFLFKSLFGIRHLYTSDVKALSHILANGSVYWRAPVTQEVRKRILGTGPSSKPILGVRPLDYRHFQDRAFGVSQIRVMTEIFVEEAVRLRDVWTSEVAQQDGTARVDVFAWLRRVTLNFIGHTGFNYQFDALETTGDGNALNDAFHELLHGKDAQRLALFRLIHWYVPVLRIVPFPGRKVAANAHTAVFSIANQIMSESKAAIQAESEGEKALDSKKDLLSILLKANLDTSLPESQRLSDVEVVAQIPAFLSAGYETTSNATSWALHALSLNPAVQTKLREEIFTISTENPTMDVLNSLPYLESVVREVMRVHAPVSFLERIAMQDDVLPLSQPYIDKTGKAHDSLLIPKGQIIHLPLSGLNVDKEIWGDDAEEFRPERWENVPSAASGIPTVWANLFTFGAGPTNCIGFRFSLTEIKALLFTLLRAFEFEPAVPKGGTGPTASPLQGPIVLTKPEKGTQLPLILKRYNVQV
ncbi:cytochrome P450 [Mycena leptocephala]|nr:cytochrome P450 [Mycena leptocephala]